MFQGNLIELRASRLLMFHQLLRCCQQVWMGDCCWVRHHPNTVIKPAATPRLYLHRIWERVPVSHRRRGSSVCFICCGPVARWETFYHPYQLSHLLLKSSVSWISACQTTLQKLSPPFDIHVYSNNTAEPNLCIFEPGNIGVTSAFMSSNHFCCSSESKWAWERNECAPHQPRSQFPPAQTWPDSHALTCWKITMILTSHAGKKCSDLDVFVVDTCRSVCVVQIVFMFVLIWRKLDFLLNLVYTLFCPLFSWAS